MYYYITNLQGDVIAITDSSGTVKASYEYDAWGKLVSDEPTDNSIGDINPLRYRGYYYDSETGLYYLQSRYYDPEVCRFINADEANNLAANGDYVSYNLFAYCGNDPIGRIDPTGEAWWHWALGAAVVALCAVATVATCGGFAAAAMAVGMVGSGVAATTAASTVAAAAFIGSATIYGASALTAASSSDSVQEFFDQGNWGTVAATAGGAAFGAYNGYALYGSQSSQSVTSSTSPSGGSHTSGTGSPKNNINPGGSYTKTDSSGNLYSYTQFDELGRQTMRIDYQGRPHAGVIPHIHLFNYPTQGGRAEYVFDLRWNLIN